MRLATLAEYRRLVYVKGSEPTLKLLRRRINEIPGGRVELGRYYVDMDANDEVNKVDKAVHAKADRFRNDPRLRGMI